VPPGRWAIEQVWRQGTSRGQDPPVSRDSSEPIIPLCGLIFPPERSRFSSPMSRARPSCCTNSALMRMPGARRASPDAPTAFAAQGGVEWTHKRRILRCVSDRAGASLRRMTPVASRSEPRFACALIHTGTPLVTDEVTSERTSIARPVSLRVATGQVLVFRNDRGTRCQQQVARPRYAQAEGPVGAERIYQLVTASSRR